MDYLKAAANQAFNAYNNGIFRLAYQSINGNSSSTYRALGFTTTQKRNLMKPFEGRHRTEFFTWLNDLDAEGSTPLRARTLGAGQYAMGYVSGSLRIGARDTYTYDNKTYRYDPLNGLDCRRSIHILLTDGEWNDSGITLPASYKVDDRPGNNETTTIDVPTPQAGTLGPNTPIVTYSGNIALDNSGHIYRDPTTLTLADLSFNYWATDLRSDLSNNIKAKLFKKGDETFTSGTVSKTVPEWWNPKNNPATWQNLQTYTIGFGPVTQLPELAKPGGGYYSDPQDYMYVGNFFLNKITGQTNWPAASSNSTNNRYDLWHAAYNGRGKYYAANDSASLKKAFDDILASVTEAATGHATVSASAAASRLTTDTMAYIASYHATNGVWTGTVEFWKAGDLGIGAATPLASANVPAAASRSIVTWREGTGGIPFQWSNISSGLTPAQLTALNLGNDATIVNALRAKPLGDIVHSNIALVGKPSGASLSTGYLHFANKVNGATPRTRVVYIGANDGMLHGFDAGNSTSANPGTGAELVAYVPRGMIRDLKTYVAADYAHRYWVDGAHLPATRKYRHKPANREQAGTTAGAPFLSALWVPAARGISFLM